VTIGLLGAFAATVAALGAIFLAAGLSRAPPLHSSTPPLAAPALVPGPRLWVCVTQESYCTSPPRPLEEPCACLDPWQGWVPGRVRTDRATMPRTTEGWPSRPPADPEDEPTGTWLLAP
jgi:hypothetical protein